MALDKQYSLVLRQTWNSKYSSSLWDIGEKKQCCFAASDWAKMSGRKDCTIDIFFCTFFSFQCLSLPDTFISPLTQSSHFSWHLDTLHHDLIMTQDLLVDFYSSIKLQNLFWYNCITTKTTDLAQETKSYIISCFSDLIYVPPVCYLFNNGL